MRATTWILQCFTGTLERVWALISIVATLKWKNERKGCLLLPTAV
jgi:hypothetical protein